MFGLVLVLSFLLGVWMRQRARMRRVQRLSRLPGGHPDPHVRAEQVRAVAQQHPPGSPGRKKVGRWRAESRVRTGR